MNRAQEFGLGATFKEKHPNGTEVERNAIEAVGGTRDNAQARMLPSEDTPVHRSTWDDVTGSGGERDRQELREQRSREWYD